MKILSGTAALPAAMVALPAWAQEIPRYGYDHPHMGGYGYDGGLMFLGPVFMLLLLAALVVGIIALLRWMNVKPGSESDGAASAMAMLNQRLAKGEIDAKEYSERKALLQG